MIAVLVASGCGADHSSPPAPGSGTPASLAPGSPTTDPTPAAAVAAISAPVLAHLPTTVANRPRTRVTRLTAQWGDPAITLRCGVAKPAALTSDAQCDGVNGVGWFTEQVIGGYRFTTIGRAGYLEVSVPSSVQPPSDVLVDLSGAAEKLRLVKPCV